MATDMVGPRCVAAVCKVGRGTPCPPFRFFIHNSAFIISAPLPPSNTFQWLPEPSEVPVSEDENENDDEDDSPCPGVLAIPGNGWQSQPPYAD